MESERWNALPRGLLECVFVIDVADGRVAADLPVTPCRSDVTAGDTQYQDNAVASVEPSVTGCQRLFVTRNPLDNGFQPIEDGERRILKTRKGSMAEIDVVDRCLIALLQTDGRLSHAEIARRLAIPEPTVRRRMKRLLADGAMQIVAVPDPHKIGYGIQAIVGAKVQPGRNGDVVAALMALRQVRYVGVTAGTYDIVIEALFKDNEDLRVFLTETLGQIEGLLGTETSYVLQIAKRSYKIGLAADIQRECVSREDDDVLRRCRAALNELEVARQR
jgi:Lrp/AsnC family transcriptional regulator for asnA, asnC and gidA